MSFLTDVFEGNFGNLGHDLTAHIGQDLPYYGLAALGGLGAAGAAGVGPAASLFAPAATTGGDASALGFAGATGGAGAGLPSEITAGATVPLGPTDPGPIAGSVTSTAGNAGGAAGGGGGFNWGDFFTKNAGGLAGAGVGAGALIAQLLQPSGAASIPGGSQVGNVASLSEADRQALLSQLQTALGTNQANTAGVVSAADQQRQGALSNENTLLQPLLTGKLPDQAEASVVQATNDAKAALRQRYANMGLSGSTQEAQALASIDQNAESQRFSIAQGMASTAMQSGTQALQALSTQSGAVSAGASDTERLLGLQGQTDTSSLGLQNQVYQSLMNQQISQNKDLSTAIANFAGALGKIQGSTGSNFKVVPS